MSSAEWVPDIEIRPQRRAVWAEIGEVWGYRELVFYLVVREIQARYRRTALGIAWLFIRPLLNTAIFVFLFGLVLRVHSDDLPYALFLLAGMLPWTFFSTAVTRSATCLRDNLNSVGKVYYPRLVLPLAATISSFVDFVAAVPLLVVLMLFYQRPVYASILLLPVFTLAAVLPALALGLLAAVFVSRYKDTMYTLNLALQAFMYATPVVYSLETIPPEWRSIVALNPMTGIITGSRWALFGSGSPPDGLFYVGMAGCLALLLAGLYLFQKTVRNIVDTL